MCACAGVGGEGRRVRPEGIGQHCRSDENLTMKNGRSECALTHLLAGQIIDLFQKLLRLLA